MGIKHFEVYNKGVGVYGTAVLNTMVLPVDFSNWVYFVHSDISFETRRIFMRVMNS